MNRPIFLLACCSCIALTAAFTLPTTSSCNTMVAVSTLLPQRTHHHHHAKTIALQNSFDDDDEEDADLANYDPAVAAQIRKARKLLRDAKQKMETEEQQEQQTESSSAKEDSAAAEAAASPLPFFAQQSFTATAIDQTTKKIKSKTKSGEIIADGEQMTSLSNTEPWELRSLSDIGFESEARSDFDGNLVADEDVKKTLAERDLAASIYNLRKVMQTEDFRRVFDSRNRFIGEVD